MQVIRTLLVDNHPLFVEAVGARLACEPDIEVLPVAADEDRARTLLRTLSPTVVVLDLVLAARSGLSLLDDIAASSPGANVVMLTSGPSADQIVEAVRRGARAWLPKTVDGERL
jgi:DNA-binding NarL/FixJ family response regulator